MNLSDAEDIAELVCGNLHRSGRGRGAGRGLREGGGHGGVERDVAFDLLHDLMDVAVEHGDRAKAAQQRERLLAVGGAPSPGGINGPERDVREDGDWRAAFNAGEVALEPVELLGTQLAHAFELQDVDQADEVNAFVIEARPAAAARVFAEALEIKLAIVRGRVMLAGHVEQLTPRAEKLAERVELLWFGGVGEVAGVDEEIGLCWARVDFAERGPERRGDVGIGGFAEADVAVADLDEAEVGLLAGVPAVRVQGLADEPRGGHAAGKGPHHAGAGPGHALEEAAAVDAVGAAGVVDRLKIGIGWSVVE